MRKVRWTGAGVAACGTAEAQAASTVIKSSSHPVEMRFMGFTLL
jgi:uncharacterized membrane protein YadS